MTRTVLLLAALLVATIARGEQTIRAVAERGNLHVGVMPVDNTWNAPVHKALVEREFNVVTVGAYWDTRHPERDRYDWSTTDAVVNWARGAGLGVHLHPLVWADDSKNPRWLTASDHAEARAILDDHIRTAMTRYRGKVDVWDVVNEAAAKDGSGGYRDGWWLQALGPDYIVEAFRLARQYDPDATLIYNEYDVELATPYQTGRWNRAQEILTTLKAENLVDGFGWQLHVQPDKVLGTDFDLAARMAWVKQQGLKNFVTELDVPIAAGDAALAQQAEVYRKIAETWLDHHNGGWFQVWGLYDKYAWRGPENRPLLFDANYAPKPAYFELRDAIARATTADFTDDGIVDGGDFLEWQRGERVRSDAESLDRWRRQYPIAPPEAAALAEPAGSALLWTSLALMRPRVRPAAPPRFYRFLSSQ
jgi:endo-1,4-beta-xylanase